MVSGLRTWWWRAIFCATWLQPMPKNVCGILGKWLAPEDASLFQESIWMFERRSRLTSAGNR